MIIKMEQSSRIRLDPNKPNDMILLKSKYIIDMIYNDIPLLFEKLTELKTDYKKKWEHYREIQLIHQDCHKEVIKLIDWLIKLEGGIMIEKMELDSFKTLCELNMKIIKKKFINYPLNEKELKELEQLRKIAIVRLNLVRMKIPNFYNMISLHLKINTNKLSRTKKMIDKKNVEILYDFWKKTLEDIEKRVDLLDDALENNPSILLINNVVKNYSENRVLIEKQIKEERYKDVYNNLNYVNSFRWKAELRISELNL
jgi:hypothetical protein